MPQTPGTIAIPSPRKSNPKKETHRPPTKKHKLAPPPFFDTSSVYSDILQDEKWFDSSDDEEYVPGEDAEAEVEEITSDHDGEGDNEEEEFDDEYYESCSSEEEGESGSSDEEELTLEPTASDVEVTPAGTPAISSTHFPETPIVTTVPETPSIAATPYAQESAVEGELFSVADISELSIDIDPDDVISKRTRAHHSLVDVELEELEKYLQASPRGSPVEFGEPFRAVEYQNFLASLQTDEIDPVLLDDDNDADFDYVAELSQAKELEEQDEYRNDRAVQVSKKEIDELIRGQELELVAIENSCQQTKRRRKTRSATKEANQKLGPLKAIRPFADVTRPSYAFTQPQLQQLQKQIADHVQLLLQIYLYSRREQNADCTEQSWNLLTEMSALREAGIAEQPMLFTANSAEELENSPGIENAKPSHVLFYTHVLDQMDNLKQLVEADLNPTVKSSEIILEVFSETFNPELKHVPSNQPSGSRLQFTPAEDALLALGLEKHGAQNWESIIKDFLPSKTVANLTNRFKNMTARRAADNPIKAYKTARKIPLTPHEEILLQQGLRTYGDNWDAIAKNLMPNRAGHVLKKNYEDMQKKRANEIAVASASAAALTKPIAIAPQPIAALKKPVLTINPIPILPRPLVPLTPAPVLNTTTLPSAFHNPPLTPVSVPSPTPPAATTTSTAANTTTSTRINNPGFRTIRVNINANGRRKRNDPNSDITSTSKNKNNKGKSNTTASKAPLKPMPTQLKTSAVAQNGVQNGSNPTINEIFLLSDQTQLPAFTDSPGLDAPPITYPYYPTIQNQTAQDYDGMYAPENTNITFDTTYDVSGDDRTNIRTSTNSNDSDEFEFEELDSDTVIFDPRKALLQQLMVLQEFDVDAMGDAPDLMPLTISVPSSSEPPPPSSPTASDPPFPFQSPHLPFTPNTPTTPSAIATPHTPFTSPLGALNIFSLDILSTSPATPSATPTKSAGSTPTPTKMNSPNRSPPTNNKVSPKIAVNLATKFTSLPTSPNNPSSTCSQIPSSPSKLFTEPSSATPDLSVPTSAQSTTLGSISLANLPSKPPSDIASDSLVTPSTTSPPSESLGVSPESTSIVATPPAASMTPAPLNNTRSGQSFSHSPPTVPITPPTSTNELAQNNGAAASVVPSTPPTSETDIHANNRVVLECGNTLVWSKEEDRAILLAAKSKQVSETFMDCWMRQAVGQLSKTPSQIEKRYEQLLQLMQLYNAKSGKSTSVPGKV